MSADDWGDLKKEICTQLADPPRRQHWTKIRQAAPAFILTEKSRSFVTPALHLINFILEKRTWSVVYTLTPP
jgi:hypothetical protein